MNDYKNCPFCGALLNDEDVCPYCKQTINKKEKIEELKKDEHKFEYPVIEVKNVNISPIILLVAIIVGFVFLAGGSMWAIIPLSFVDEGASIVPFIVVGILFLAIALVIVIPTILPFIIRRKVLNHGREYSGTIYCYEDNPFFIINGLPDQIMYILIQTDEGPKLARYDLRSGIKPYKEKSTIRLKMLDNKIVIEK